MCTKNGSLMLLGGHFFRAGGAEKLELFQIVSLIPLPKKSFVARFGVQNAFFRRLRRVFLYFPFKFLWPQEIAEKRLWR